jgi:predicted metal-dependent hydrolase
MPQVEITVRRSARARNYSLRISGLDGKVTLTLPKRGNLTEAMAFAQSREAWIRRMLAGQPEIVPVGLGMEIPYQGRALSILASEVRAPRPEGAALLVPPDPRQVGLRVQTFLKASARRHLVAASEHYATALGRPVGRISLRDTRSRWGSCTASGDLMYSWRLIMAPAEVLDYVAAHEVAHLVEMNHSQDFWDVVAGLCPDYARHRAWLRREGAALHRYRFTD